MGETTIITPNVDTAHVNDGDTGYEQQMLEKADKGLGSTPEPKLFAGKYKTEEDLSKGVLELIKMQHGGDLESFYVTQQKNLGKKGEGGDVKPPEQSPGTAKTTIEPPEEGTEEVPTTINFDKYNQEFLESGDISQDSIEELGKFGIDEDTVRNYVEGIKALQAANNNHAYGLVGGESNYAAMVQFARTSMSAEEIQQFNTQVTGRDLGKREEAIKSLYSKYTEANPQFLEGASGASASSSDIFRTENEFKQAMKDPRYKKDAAYRDTVLAKLERSNL